MNKTPVEREYFFDSIRAWLMLLGIPFHISLIYSSHSWHVNSLEPSWGLTLFNDFIHAFRMQVFFVISGYQHRRIWLSETGGGGNCGENGEGFPHPI